MGNPRVVVNNFSFFIFSVLLSFATVSQSYDDCVYNVYIRTSEIINGGTDSIISLKLYDVYRNYIEVPDLEEWGLMEHNHNYFERGNLDIFSIKGECLSGPVCAMNLTSDGSGAHHGWYCNYVEVTASGPRIPCTQKLFKVEQWLALDTAPHKLTVIRNDCPLPVVSDNNVVDLITVGEKE